MNIRDFKTIEERKNFIESKTGKKFEAIGIYPNGLDVGVHKNCENMIGAVSIPIGIAGPVLIKGKEFAHELYLPLATTEGALVASVSRGCKAITNSGGAHVFSEYKGITRGSVYEVKNLEEGFFLKKWIGDNIEEIKNIAAGNSNHTKLQNVDIKIAGNKVFMRFSFDTKDAMGMNMATIASDRIARYIYDKLKIKCIAVAGNYDTDKKPSWLNFVSGRGRQVWAETVIDEKTVMEVLKTTPEKIYEVWVNKCMLGSAMSGSLGFNAHFANVIAALFLSCGQDPAHVVEGSMGLTTTEIIKDTKSEKLYVSVYLPDLVLGTIGGGTNLPAQKEMLEMLGVYGGDDGKNAEKFAQIAGAAVLAGEISLLASLAEGSLATAHKKLARGMKI
jgi:hydroxymethylglutaryl-CoA reductase (NADPH)